MEIKLRQTNLKNSIRSLGLDAIVINPSASLYYLTGLDFHLSERPIVFILPVDGHPVIVLPKLEVAKIENAQYIGTGESLGQVSSQTLANIAVIEQAANFRVLKPLITFDKAEIIKMTKEIKTFEISAGPEVCDLLGPKHPIVNADLENTLNEEEKLTGLEIVSNSMKSLQVTDLL